MMHDKIDTRKRVFGDGHYLRPYMFQTYNCKNILLSGVTMINSPMWFIGPVMCENLTVEKVRIQSHGPNTDGCDPDACKNVLIKDCYFDTGDDCIAIKSGRDEDGRGFGRPAENHLIEGCEMKDGHGGVVIGSEIAGGARNIYAINCKMSSENLDRVLRIKTSSSRGGIIENIFLKDITVGSYKESAIHCNMFYENPGNFIPTVRNIWVENLTVTDAGEYAIFINAYKESPVQHLKLVNCTINGVKEAMKIDHVEDMDFKNVTINGKLVAAPASDKKE
jgi:polygalacturonase